MGHGFCSRCESWMLEHLSTYSHCWECGYIPSIDTELRQWERIEFPSLKRKSLSRRDLHNLIGQTNRLSDLRA